MAELPRKGICIHYISPGRIKNRLPAVCGARMLKFCHSGLDPESSSFFAVVLLDAGSVIPDLIRNRHDGQRENTVYN